MNKIIFSLLIMALPMMIQAQITVSPKVGMNYLWVGERPQAIETMGASKGWLAGVDLRIGKKFYLQPGIYYTATDAAIESIEDIQNIRTGRASFLKIPVNVGVKMLKSSPVNLRFHAGGVANKFLSVSKDNELSSEDFNTWSYAANMGLGVDLLIFSVDANYEIGLTDLYQIEGGSKPTMFSLTFGLKF